MLKNACFFEKYCKNPSCIAPPPDPHVVTLTYYYNFIEFVSCVKCVSLTSKKDRVTRTCSAVTFSALLHLFFISNSADFMTGAQVYFLPQGSGYPSYAIALRVVPAQYLVYAAKKFLP